MKELDQLFEMIERMREKSKKYLRILIVMFLIGVLYNMIQSYLHVK